MKAIVSLLIAVVMVALASEAFATKIYRQVQPGSNCVGDYLASSEVDTIDFIFPNNVPYSSASWGVAFDSLAAHGTFTAKVGYFPGTLISADMSPHADTTATLLIGIDTLNQTSLYDTIYWQKPAALDSIALLPWVDESYYWSDGFRMNTANLVRVIVSLSSGTGGYILCLNLFTQ